MLFPDRKLNNSLDYIFRSRCLAFRNYGYYNKDPRNIVKSSIDQINLSNIYRNNTYKKYIFPRLLGGISLFVYATYFATLSTPSFAQSTTTGPLLDEYGFDLINHSPYFSSEDISIGDGIDRLSYVRNSYSGYQAYDVSWIYESNGSANIILQMGSTKKIFARNPSGSGWLPQPDGSTFEEGKYTDRYGLQYIFEFYSGSTDQNDFIARATKLIFPNKSIIRINWTSRIVQNSSEGILYQEYYDRIQSITNGSGYQLKFYYQSNDPPVTGDDHVYAQWLTLTKITAINNAIDPCDPGVDNCPSFSEAWPTVSYLKSANTLTVSGPGDRHRVYSNNGAEFSIAGDSSENMKFSSLISGANIISTLTRKGASLRYTFNSSLAYSISREDAFLNKTVFQLGSYPQNATHIASITDAKGRSTNYSYDAQDRISAIRNPEGNTIKYSYDLRGNVIESRIVAKGGTGTADLVQSSDYPASCSNVVTCNKPVWTRDAKGAQTDYAYDSVHGGVTAVTAPAPTAGATRPQTRYGYAPFQAQYKNSAGAIVASGYPTYLLTSVSQCSVGSSCAGTAAETRTAINYGPQTAGVTNNLLPVSVTTSAGNNSLVAPAAFTYDSIGNRITVDGPLGTALNDVSRVRYDAARRVVGTIGPDPDGPGAMKPRAQRITYDPKGQVNLVEAGTVETQSDADWANFASLHQVASVYDANDRKTKDTITAGGTTYGVTQYSYDAAGRSDCSTVRLNPAAYGALPASACTLGPTGADGPDRIVKLGYDPTGRVTSKFTALGAGAAFETEEKLSYTPNGQVDTVTDGNGNVTNQDYDGFDRASVTYYPSPSAPGTSNGGDYEQLTYDANGNVTQRRLRDGNVTNYGYDALNRLIAKDRPEIPYNTDLTYTYDLLGRVTASNGNWFGAATYGYDALGRLLSEASAMVGTTSWAYDVAGRKTRQTWSDGQYVNYTYLRTGEMSGIRDAANAALVTFLYDAQGRRTNLNRANGTKTAYAYDSGSRLTQLTQNLLATAQDLTLGFSYTQAGQIKTRTSSNNAYAWTKHYNADRPYGVNGLNQLTAAGAAPLGYDARGNLTTSNGATYAYNGDNQLVDAPGTGRLVYDNAERLFHIVSENSRFAYDGGNMIAEYDHATQAIRRRYVFGPNADEPLIWYEGAGMTDRRFFHADERGSVIAVSDASGAATNILSYDEYGIPGAGNGTVRFQYTGQKWIPGLGMYDYKARMYSPTLGRFMQTDPIGYGDGMNWYNYVGSDPVNGTDPSGRATVIGPSCSGGGGVPTPTRDGSDGYGYGYVCSGGGGGGGTGGYSVQQDEADRIAALAYRLSVPNRNLRLDGVPQRERQCSRFQRGAEEFANAADDISSLAAQGAGYAAAGALVLGRIARTDSIAATIAVRGIAPLIRTGVLLGKVAATAGALNVLGRLAAGDTLGGSLAAGTSSIAGGLSKGLSGTSRIAGDIGLGGIAGDLGGNALNDWAKANGGSSICEY